MSRVIALALCAAGAVAAGAQAQVAYSLTVENFYQFGAPSDHVAGPAGAPDTGFSRFRNTGSSSSFTGTLSISGVDGFGNNWFTSINIVNLGPGASPGSMSLNNESSNFGGYNKDPGNPDLGALMRFVGTVTDGVNTDNLDLQVYDKDVHSGVFRVNPFGETVDNYVIQGGDPFGRDTGDDFEVTQDLSHYTWEVVPAPGSVGLLGLAGLAAARRRR